MRLPRLPGHGTRWQDADHAPAGTDWYGEVERAFDDLRGRCDQVFVMGLSMGGTLALRLAEQRPDEVAGLVLVNPSVLTQRKDVSCLLPVLRLVVPAFPGIGSDIKKPGVTEHAYDKAPLKAACSSRELWKTVRADLASVRQPLLRAPQPRRPRRRAGQRRD